MSEFVEFDMWRNLCGEMFWFELGDMEYWVPVNGTVQFPSKYHDIPPRRGLALEFVAATVNGAWPEPEPKLEPEVKPEPVKPSKKKPKSKI